MGRGHWTRWGRGDCEGHSLWLGDLVRGQVVRNLGEPPTWRASVNQTDLGAYRSVDQAKAVVEDHVIRDMRMALEDWTRFGAGQPKR